MKIAVISKADVTGGGASVVATQMTKAFAKLGHKSEHFHLLNTGGGGPLGPYQRIVRALKGVEGRLGFRDHFPIEKWFGSFKKLTSEFDAIHLHDTSTILSHSSIIWLANRVPTLWTIHDCSPFTAGCLYPTGCNKFTAQCGQCPQIGNWPLNSMFDRTPRLHTRRKKVQYSKIRFSAPSQWMIDEYLRAGWPSEKIQLVENAVDRDLFRPRNRDVLKVKYGISDHKGPLLLFSAGWLHDERKGPREAAKLISSLRHLNAKLVLVGRYSNEAAIFFRHLDVVHFGFVKSPLERAELYGMCDGTLTFSQQENAPLIAIESLAVGTPVFGYKAGGLVEIVTNNETGYLRPAGDIAGVARDLEKMLSKNTEVTRNRCVESVKRNHDEIDAAKKFIDIFENREF